MKPFVLFIVGLVGLGGFAIVEAQSGEGSYEGLVKEMLSTVEQITKTLQTVKDRTSAETARPELRKAAEKMLELRKKAEEWKQPNKEEKDRLAKEYAPKLEGAVKQLREATVLVKGVPGGEEAIAELAILKDKVDKDEGKTKSKK
jgi:hypothetical protein